MRAVIYAVLAKTRAHHGYRGGSISQQERTMVLIYTITLDYVAVVVVQKRLRNISISSPVMANCFSTAHDFPRLRNTCATWFQLKKFQFRNDCIAIWTFCGLLHKKPICALSGSSYTILTNFTHPHTHTQTDIMQLFAQVLGAAAAPCTDNQRALQQPPQPSNWYFGEVLGYARTRTPAPKTLI